MRSKIISHLLCTIITATASLATEHAVHVTIVLRDAYFGDVYPGNMHHGNMHYMNPPKIAHLTDELEDAQLNLALARSMLDPLQERQAALATAELNAATGLSRLTFLEQLIGREDSIPLEERLENLFTQMGIQGISLDTAIAGLTADLEDVKGDNLSEKIKNLREDKDKDAVTKRALERVILAQKMEQQETKSLLKDILQQRFQADPLPESAQKGAGKEEAAAKETSATQPTQGPLPTLLSSSLTPPLSPYQEQLRSRRHQIGEKAWQLLGGENPSLAAALLGSIQQNLGKTIEILYLGKNSFTLRVNKKEQYKPYKF